MLANRVSAAMRSLAETDRSRMYRSRAYLMYRHQLGWLQSSLYRRRSKCSRKILGEVFFQRQEEVNIVFHDATKIILNRCQNFHLKYTKFNFRLGIRPRPRYGFSQRSPRPLAGFGEKGRKWKRKERRKGELKGGEEERDGVG